MKLISFILMLVLVPVFWANAQPTELKEAKEDLRESYEKLVEVKASPDLTQAEQDRQELVARINALQEVVRFTSIETQSLIDKLNSLKGLSLEAINLQAVYLNNLKDFLLLQKNYLDKLVGYAADPLTSLDQVKQIALDFKLWRESSYDPTVKRIISFTLVFRGSELLTITTNRFNKISIDLKTIQNSKSLKIDGLISILDQAGVLLKEATNLNRSAQIALFVDSSDPSETTILVEQLLGKIRGIYSKFLDMSNLLKKMLAG